jgi:hypothetical protein
MKSIALAVAIVLCVGSQATALDTSQFSELVGYTVVTVTNARGTVEGVDYDTRIKLDNNMIFEFHTYSYFYEYRPDVVVFAKDVSYQGKTVTLYKLIIADEDEVFDVTRVR